MLNRERLPRVHPSWVVITAVFVLIVWQTSLQGAGVSTGTLKERLRSHLGETVDVNSTTVVIAEIQDDYFIVTERFGPGMSLTKIYSYPFAHISSIKEYPSSSEPPRIYIEVK